MAKTKVFQTEEGYFSANSKKEVADFFQIKESKVKVVSEEIPETEVVQSLQFLIQKKFQISEARKFSQFSNTPTRFFAIGEPVKIGNLKDFYVTEIFDDGKFYCIEDGQGSYRLFQWFELQKQRSVEENNKIESFAKEDKLFLNFYQQDVSSLLSRYYNFGVDMNPPYQRDLVWTLQQKEDLISSIFQRIDIGKFVFIKNKFKVNEPNYQILDGKQRLNTLIEFYEDRFPFNGKVFSELSWSDQHVLTGLSVSVAEVREEDADEKSIVEYFIKLNISGTPVEKEFLLNLQKKYLS